jgi:hypothetical protein
MRRRSFGPPTVVSRYRGSSAFKHDGYGRGSRVVERPRKLPIAAALTRPCATDVVAAGVLLGLLAGGSCYPSHSRRGQTLGCRHNSANSSVRRPCHIQHHEFRRNAPSQWHATRPNAAGHVEILSSLPNKSVAPTQRCLASIFQNADARHADLAAMRVSGKCQMGSAWYVREPHRIVRKYNARPLP